MVLLTPINVFSALLDLSQLQVTRSWAGHVFTEVNILQGQGRHDSNTFVGYQTSQGIP